MLLNPSIPPEAIKTQEISINLSSYMSISRSSIVFSSASEGQEGALYVMNFWLERNQLDVKEHSENGQEAQWRKILNKMPQKNKD